MLRLLMHIHVHIVNTTLHTKLQTEARGMEAFYTKRNYVLKGIFPFADGW